MIRPPILPNRNRLIILGKEQAVMDGTVELGIEGEWGKEKSAGQVYRAGVDRPVSQFFVDGEMMPLARLPNALAEAFANITDAGSRHFADKVPEEISTTLSK